MREDSDLDLKLAAFSLCFCVLETDCKMELKRETEVVISIGVCQVAQW